MKKFFLLFFAAAAAALAQVQIPWADIVDKPSTIGGYGLTSDIGAVRNSLAPRQALVIDGTPGVKGLAALGSPLGAADYTIAWISSFPETLPGGEAGVFGYGDSTSNYQGGVNVIVKTGAVGNSLVLEGRDAGGNFGRYIYDLTPCLGRTAHLALVRTGAVLTLYVNGVAVSGTYSGTTGVFADAQTATYFVAGADFPAMSALTSTLSLVGIYNRALSASEVTALYRTGAPPDPDYTPGTGLKNSATFLNQAASYTTFSGATASGFTAVAPGGGGAAYSAPFFSFRLGNRVRLTYTLAMTSGQVPFARLSNLGVGDASAITQLAAGTNTLDLVATADGAISTGTVYLSNSAASSYTLSNVSVVVIGLVCALDTAAAGNGCQWKDVSGNSSDLTLAAGGARWLLRSDAPNRLRGRTATNGNQQLLGATSLEANTQLTRLRARAFGGTPSITLGTTSGGAEIAASVALSTAWKDIPIALTGGIVSSASSVWVGSSSTDPVEILFSTQKL